MADKEYELALVEERAVAQIQAMATRLLASKNITKKALAEDMGVSQPYVSQIFADEPVNLTVKNAARIFFHLGEKLEFRCDGIDALNAAAEARNSQRAALMEQEEEKGFAWVGCANSNNDEFEFCSADFDLAAA